ncbi:FxLD family lanthipeptide [Streptacidiphilus albus]|uniref:FxLD family lanthipeptide n=1 Tax=Streptacidiphilus albus TaxID=105425 RepID=UPI0009E07A84|nr:FxLD family lanthipeptide [Streptacidiphilus albus]
MAPTAPSSLDRTTGADVDPLDLDLTVITEVGTAAIPGCDTSDGCGSTCASACNSAV